MREPSQSPVRLLAVDLDGTLLADDKIISTVNLEALARVRRSGVKVVIASARPPRSVRAVYQSLGLDTLTINYNGALIWNPPTSRAAFHRPLPGTLALEMIHLARRMDDDVVVTCEVLDRWHTDRVEQPYTTETGRIFRPDVIAPLTSICASPITKLMFLGEPRNMLPVGQALLGRFGTFAAVLHCEGELLQVMNNRASKAIALRQLAEIYGVEMDQVMAIGDASNDIDMLKAAGIAVAMGNAPKAVQDVAHWIAPTNNQDGVAAAIERFILKNPARP